MNMNTKAKIAIVGHGFVGSATDNGFNKDTKKIIIDPKYGTNVRELEKFQPDVSFVCVPTPMSKEGNQNSDILKTVISDLLKHAPKTIIVIKSTVLPSVLDDLCKSNSNIIYNPEFLREKYATEDFINSEMIILGGEKNLCEKVAQIYKKNSCCKTDKYIFVDAITASLIKYSINTFLATKVVFFNELFNLFTKYETSNSWQDVISFLANDPRIGSSHMNVPGHDGRKGFGGACFPKDTHAFYKEAETKKITLEVLKSAINKNNKIRKNYPDLIGREHDQDTFFEDV